MNENINRIYEDEKTVDLLSLCLYVLGKWKFIVLVALIGAIALGGLSYAKSYQTINNNVSEVKEPAVSEHDKAAACAKFEMIEAYEYYCDHSIMAKMDSNSIPLGKLTYLISTENMQDMLKVLDCLEAKLLSADNLKLLSERLSESTDESMLREAITLSRNHVFSDAQNNVVIVQDFQDIEFEIMVCHYNREDCETMMRFFEEQMKECQGMFADTQVMALSSRMEVINERLLLELFGATIKVGRLSGYEAIRKLKKDMTAEQTLYYDYLKAKEEQANTEETDVAGTLVKPSVDVVYVTIGAVAGAFCMVVLYAALYLFGGRVRAKEELKSWMNTPVLDDCDVDLLATHIKGIAANYDVENIFFTGSLEKKNTERMLQIKNILAEKGIKVVLGNSILKDAEALQEAAGCGYMILLEKYHVSKEKDIREEFVKASSCGIKILSVILEK